jgi:hypothetical protein
MLKGAAQVLRECAPKLSICTYHLEDDPEIIERLVKESNPDYQIIQTDKKLFAYTL